MEVITTETTETDMFLLNWWQDAQKAPEKKPISIRLYRTPLNLLFLPSPAQISSSPSSVTCLFGWTQGVTAPAVPGW